MKLEESLTLRPSESRYHRWLSDDDNAVLQRVFRCERGCIGTFEQHVPREILRESGLVVALDDLAFEWASTHACLRKALVGDRHRCALCGWADVVNRHGGLRSHQWSVRRPSGALPWNGPIEAEVCPGSVGRRVDA